MNYILIFLFWLSVVMQVSEQSLATFAIWRSRIVHQGVLIHVNSTLCEKHWVGEMYLLHSYNWTRNKYLMTAKNGSLEMCKINLLHLSTPDFMKTCHMQFTVPFSKFVKVSKTSNVYWAKNSTIRIRLTWYLHVSSDLVLFSTKYAAKIMRDY